MKKQLHRCPSCMGLRVFPGRYAYDAARKCETCGGRGTVNSKTLRKLSRGKAKARGNR